MRLSLPLMIVLAMVTFGQAKASHCHSCPRGWSLFQRSCYRYFGDRVTWNEALKRCRRHSFRGVRADLVSIHSTRENDFAYDLFRSAAGITPDYKGKGPYYGAWIGFYQQTRGSTGPFVWSDGTLNKDFSSWLPGEPNNVGKQEDCAHIWRRNSGDDRLRYWNDLKCSVDLAYICKVAPNY